MEDSFNQNCWVVTVFKAVDVRVVEQERLLSEMLTRLGQVVRLLWDGVLLREKAEIRNTLKRVLELHAVIFFDAPCMAMFKN